MSVSAIDIAIIGQYAENIYFGKPCGLMDQMACSVGNLVYIDFENTSKPVVEKVEFDMEKYGYSLCITDTKGSHADLTDEYAAVPKEMKQVAKHFGKEVLRGITAQDIIREIQALRSEFGDRSVLRALHFVSENDRVTFEVEALKTGDFVIFLNLVKASGDSSYKFDLYGTDVAPDLIDCIEQGVIQAMNGGNHVNGAISLCLLVNYLDGHQILDADGKPPVLDYLSTYLITPDNAAHFKALYADESCFISDEQFQSLLYKYNPDVTVDTYDESLKTYADTIYNLPE